MTYRSRRADLNDDLDVENLRDLHILTFGDSAPLVDFNYGAWWLVYPTGEEDPIAFAGVVQSSLGTGYAYLKRAGVLLDHRGHGLQRRMIQMRVRWAKKEGFHTVVTEADGHHSGNNLIRSGFTLFEPDVKWGVKGANYYRRRVQ